MSELLLDAAGRRRSPATLPQFHAGRPPRNKGMRYPADPPTIEEIVAVMRRAGDSVHAPPAARPDRRAVASRPAHLRGARARRGRPGRAPHQLRHAHAVEMAREGVPLIVIQRQLGHTNLGITSIYLQGIDNTEIIDTVHARRAPMVSVHSSLRV